MEDDVKFPEKMQGRTVLFYALVGSHNYNLNTPESDKDYKVFIAPTFDDLYDGNMYTNSVVTDTLDYTVHDIRKLVDLLWKSNPAFLEVLFSKEVHIYDTPFKKIIEELYDKREDIARINLPYLWNATYGTAVSKFNNLEKGTAGTKNLVDKYGYDTKQGMHCIRYLLLLERYSKFGFKDYGSTIWFGDDDYDPHRADLLGIKEGDYTLESIRVRADNMFRLANALYKDGYNEGVEADTRLRDHIQESIKRGVSNSLYDEFITPEEQADVNKSAEDLMNGNYRILDGKLSSEDFIAELFKTKQTF